MIKSFLRSILRSIKNLFFWLPVIWKDKPYDYVYFFIILRHKLIQMRDFFNSDKAFSMDSKKDAEKIDICIKLLNRLIKDDYFANACISFDKKWGKMILKTINNKNVVTEEYKKEYMKDLKKCSEISEKMILQDLELLTDMLKRNIRYWWD